MFTKKFDRRFRAIVLVKMCVLPIALPFGLYAMWPANVEQGYKPEQPIAFSHKLHAGELQINCVYCHSNVNEGPHATVPAVSTCMKCHSQVQPKVTVVEAISAHDDHGKHDEHDHNNQAHDKHHVKLEAKHAFGLGDNLVEKEILNPEIKKLLDYYEQGEPIRWVKIHDLADFVYFDHSRHMAAGLDCIDCHGEIDKMDVVYRKNSLKMAWCLKCHRQPPTENTSEEYKARGNRGPEHCFACHR